MIDAIRKLLGTADTPDESSPSQGAVTEDARADAGGGYEAWSPTGSTGDAGADVSEAAEPADAPGDTAAEPVAPAPAGADGDAAPGMEAQVIDAIRLVYDPEIPVNIYELGLIYGVDIAENNDVHVQMTLTAPGCPVAGDMPGWVAMAIESNVPDAGEVDVEIVWDPPWTPDMMSEAAQLELGYL